MFDLILATAFSVVTHRVCLEDILVFVLKLSWNRFECSKAILCDQKGENGTECLQICQKTLCLGFSLPVQCEQT